MGGTVAVAFRLRDGTIKTQACWTNALPGWLFNPKFYHGDEAHIARFFEDNPDPVPVAPISYGLILFDYVTGHFMNMQGYTPFDQRHPVSIMQGMGEKAFTTLIAEKRLSERTYLGAKGLDPVILTQPLPADVTDFASLCRRAEALWEAERRSDASGDGVYRRVVFAVDTAPLTYIDFDETAQGAKDYLAKLDAIGFPLTEVDRAAWQAWISECQ